jgi:hypothetical protein
MPIMDARTLPTGTRPSLRRALLCCALVLPGLLCAQLFDLGVKGGLSQDDLRTSYAHEALIGGHAGLFMRVKPPILPGGQAELLLNSFGSRVTVNGVEGDLRSLALQLPVFVVFALGPVELHGGGYYERYLTQELANEFNVDLNDLPVEAGQLYDEGYGLLVGGGLRLGHFYAGVRYNMGMQDLGTGPFLSDVRTRQLQAYLGIGFFKKPD